MRRGHYITVVVLRCGGQCGWSDIPNKQEDNRDWPERCPECGAEAVAKPEEFDRRDL